MRTPRMALVGGFAGALIVGNVATLYAAPLPTNVASMKSMVADSSIQMIRWGGWRGGGWGYRGFGGWGRGGGWAAGALAGALIGGAIASSAYGYYGGPYYGGYYPAYSYYPVDYGWQAIQEPGAARFYRPYGPWGYW
jgi:hypothetical protein